MAKKLIVRAGLRPGFPGHERTPQDLVRHQTRLR
jgi:hypothetical protein